MSQVHIAHSLQFFRHIVDGWNIDGLATFYHVRTLTFNGSGLLKVSAPILYVWVAKLYSDGAGRGCTDGGVSLSIARPFDQITNGMSMASQRRRSLPP